MCTKVKRIIDHCWVPVGNNHFLIVLAYGNTIYIVQNDVLKRTHVIETSQISMMDVTRGYVDMFFLNSYLDKILI
jgi:hypothetical protein